MATERIEIGYDPLSNIDYPKIPSFFLFIRIWCISLKMM